MTRGLVPQILYNNVQCHRLFTIQTGNKLFTIQTDYIRLVIIITIEYTTSKLKLISLSLSMDIVITNE